MLLFQDQGRLCGNALGTIELSQHTFLDQVLLQLIRGLSVLRVDEQARARSAHAGQDSGLLGDNILYSFAHARSHQIYFVEQTLLVDGFIDHFELEQPQVVATEADSARVP